MKIIKYLLITLFFIFSIYYTEKSMDILKLNDPIMKEIKNNLNKYKIEPVNAIIKNNTIIPGKKGKEIDIKETYSNMRKYGSYNETLIKTKETLPVISITNNLDKYIKIDKNYNKQISLIFIINKETNLNKIINILNKYKVNKTFYIEENLLEKYTDIIKNNKLEIGIFNPNKKLFKTTKSYIETLINKEINYCYTEKEDNELLNICKNNNMYTFIPSIIIKNDLYKNIKLNIDKSKIISIYPNKYIEKELITTIEYLNKKGYEFLELNKLLNEAY